MKKKNIDFSKRQILVIIICLCLFLGIILGAIGANNLSEVQYNELGSYLGSFIDGIKNSGTTELILSDVILKYGKYVVMIWCCGFIAPGAVMVLVIIIFKGISYGFTTALLVKQYGQTGIKFAALSYLPQNIILIPAYIFIAYVSIEYILKKFKVLPPKARLKREKHKSYLEYIIILFAELLVVSAASIIEVYLVPILLKL